MIKLRASQEEGVNFAMSADGTLWDWGMGSGKTIGAIALAKRTDVKRMLVVCPKYVIPVWEKEFNKFAPGEFRILLLEKGTVKKKVETMTKFLDKWKREKCVVVIGYESSWRPGLGENRKNGKIIDKGALREIAWDLCIVDEAHKICSDGSSVSKFFSRLKTSCKRRVALTGTPLTNSCLSAFGIFRFLDPDIFGTSYFRFKNHYALYGGFNNYQILRYLNQEEFNEKFFKITHQVCVDDIVELPDVVHNYIECDIEPATMTLYNEFKDDCCISVNGSDFSADNILVKTLRLAQIASGVVTDDDGNDHVLDNTKVNVTIDIIEGLASSEPVIVFTRFTPELKRLRKSLEALHYTVSQLGDGVNELKNWQDGETRVLIVNIRSGGAGIDLTRSRYCIYLSTGYSHVDYTQSLARTRRPGADLSKKIFYYHIIANNTIDVAISRALGSKANVIDAVLGHLSDKDVSRIAA